MTFGPVLAMVLSAPPFGPGEELVFQVKTLGLKSGTAQFNVGAPEPVAGTPAWPIVMVARSQGVTEAVYPVRDRFVSFWDPVRRLPIEGRLSASEGGKQRAMSIRFHRDGAEGPRAAVHGTDAQGEITELSDPMDPAAQDLQSAVYWLRLQRLDVGAHFDIPIVAGKRQWILTAVVSKAQPLEVPAGHFDAVQVALTTSFAGKLQSNGAVLAYFSADPRHLPLRFDADLKIGKMIAELTRFAVAAPLP